jgi:hypothetical protein
VIYALTDDKKAKHVPYRDSKLTRVLQNSLVRRSDVLYVLPPLGT